MLEDKNNSEQKEYVIVLKRKNNDTDYSFLSCSIILKKLIKMRDKGHLIEEPHFTNQDNIYILAYAYGAKQIDMLLKDIKEFDEIEKAEAKPLFPI
jgi:hypothetical protein